VLALCGALGLANTAARITAPVRFRVQCDGRLVAREQNFALLDTLGSAAKTSHANPANLGDVPEFETDSSLEFRTPPSLRIQCGRSGVDVDAG
jgi:hypothetical protein